MVLLLALNIKFTENKKVSFYTRVRKSRRPGQLYAAGGRGFKAIPSITRPMKPFCWSVGGTSCGAGVICFGAGAAGKTTGEPSAASTR